MNTSMSILQYYLFAVSLKYQTIAVISNFANVFE